MLNYVQNKLEMREWMHPHDDQGNDMPLTIIRKSLDDVD